MKKILTKILMLLMISVMLSACESKLSSLEREVSKVKEALSSLDGIGENISDDGEESANEVTSEDIRDEKNSINVKTDIEDNELEEEITKEDEVLSIEQSLERLKVVDSVIMDEDGIKITFDGFEMSESYLKADNYYDFWVAVFTVENNNPDYKKVKFEPVTIGLNRLYFIETNIFYNEVTVEAGDNTTVKMEANAPSLSYYKNALSFLEETPTSMPVMTVNIWFKVRVGQKEKEVYHNVELHTSEYSEDALVKCFGTPVVIDKETDDLHYDIYEKHDSGKIIVVEIKDDYGGREYAGKIEVNGNRIDAQSTTNSLLPSGGVVHRAEITEEIIRKTFEIGPNKSLTMTFSVGSVGYYGSPTTTLFTY